jgi:predicted nucleic acid-binding protein
MPVPARLALNIAAISTSGPSLPSPDAATPTFYDALIVASALEAGCTTLLSEDIQDGRVIDGRLTIRNPFMAKSSP